MVNASKRLPDNLGPLEQRVMEILWSRGPANSEQVREALGPKRRLKDSTIRTILRRLHEKGYTRYKVEGRTYVYTAAEQPRNVAVRAVRRILDRFCKGSVEELLTGMVDNEVLSRAELRELAAKIAGPKSRKGES
jgi:BlaI family transcriptional regulator, penicillinase repressor